MQPTRLCRAAMLLGGAFLIAAWVFDDPVYFFAGGAVWIFLLLSLHATITAARHASETCHIERETKERFSRSGTRIRMKTTLTSQVPPGYSVDAEEMLPDSAVDITGETKGIIPKDRGECTLQYSFRLLAHGTIHPGGVILRCSDAFFTITVPIKKLSMQVPALFVFPEKGAAVEGKGEYGDQETMRRTPLKSSGIRSFREYRQGDSIRAIDWKMTAKYGTTYVREYAGSEGGTATVVVDLPDDTTAIPEELFTSVRMNVIQRIADIQERRELSRMVILSGTTIVAVREIIPGADILHELSALLVPGTRRSTLFRTYAPAMLDIRMCAAGERMPLSASARAAAKAFSRSADCTAFEESMHRLLVLSRDTEIHCYTTGTGDLSHIWAMASSAYGLHRPVRLFLPEERYRDSLRKEAEFFHIQSLEMIT